MYLRLRGIGAPQQLGGSGEPGSHALLGNAHQDTADLAVHKSDVRSPRLVEAELFESSILGRNQLALDETQRPILHR